MNPDTTLWEFCQSEYSDRRPTREVCSRILNFICSRGYDSVWISESDNRWCWAEFEQDEHLLYRWSVSSRKVDIVGRRLRVNREHLLAYLAQHDFQPSVTYKPNRWVRHKWFSRILLIDDQELEARRTDPPVASESDLGLTIPSGSDRPPGCLPGKGILESLWKVLSRVIESLFRKSPR